MTTLAGLDKISALCGEGLTLEERAALEIGLQRRANEEGLSGMRVWGKIKGDEADYIIAVGLAASKDYPNKRFFFATSKNLKLQAFPDMTDEFTAQAAAVKGRFSGDPTKLLGKEDEDEDEKGDDDEEGAGRPPKFSEVHRLAWAVGQISDATDLVPRGSFITDATHNVLYNQSYAGMNFAQAGSLDNYFHFRRPVGLERKSALDRAGLLKGVDIFDPASEDEPKGIWAARVDKSRSIASLRSLLYPGAFFYAVVGSSEFGHCYFGDGLINSDIGFMI